MKDIDMLNNSEYDALGELFRQRLENHRIPVDGGGWDAIERRLDKGKRKAVIWMWRIGAMAAAAAVAALFILKQPKIEQTYDIAQSQQSHPETISPSVEQQTENISQSNVPIIQSTTHSKFKNNSITQLITHSKIDQDSITQLITHSKFENDSVTQLIAHSKFGVLDVSLVADNPDEDETDTRPEKWLFAAAFGIGGHTDGLNPLEHKDMSSNIASSTSGWKGMGMGNAYANNLSHNIQSFNTMSREQFSYYNHRPPFSFGVTVRKNPGKVVGLESGLVYTYLSSNFKWAGHDAHQSLHYIGIPLNLAVNLWNANPNWRIYLSGGCMVEKGLRAIYRQERHIPSEHRVTTVRSAIPNLQFSLSSAIGVNYRLDKGWGIYLEPRVGYSFNGNHPVSIRTEWPVYFGVNLGLNYEL